MQKLRSRKALAGMLAAGRRDRRNRGGDAGWSGGRDFAATNWKKIWKNELKPLADKRYYTKKKSNARYYTKDRADAKYAALARLHQGPVGREVLPRRVDASSALRERRGGVRRAATRSFALGAAARPFSKHRAARQLHGDVSSSGYLLNTGGGASTAVRHHRDGLDSTSSIAQRPRAAATHRWYSGRFRRPGRSLLTGRRTGLGAGSVGSP